MATLSHFSTLLSFSSRNLSFLDLLQTPHLQTKFHRYSHLQPYNPRRRDCAVCVCSVRKSRVSKKAKSDQELCNDIRDFIKSVGLPEDHVPSTKELSQHGRNDLANIVRRRGYKLIRQLLANSTKTVKNGRDTDNITLTGQDGEANDVVEDLSSLSKALILQNFSPSLNTNHAFSSDDCNSTPTTTANSSLEEELSYNLEFHDENNESQKKNDENTAAESYFSSSNIGSDVKSNDHNGEPMDLHSVGESECPLEYQSETINNMVYESSLSPKVLSGENYMRSSTVDENLNMGGLDDNSMLLTTGSSSKEEVLYCSNEQVEKEDSNVDDVSLSVEMTIMDDHSSDLDVDRAPDHDDSSYKLIKSSENSSLAEKVAKFIQNGDLDMIDDNFDVILSESGAGENNGLIGAGNAEETQINTHGEACSEEAINRGFNVMASDGSALESGHIMSSTTVNQSLSEALSGQIDTELGTERRGDENQVEIDRLKYMLHQKELELSQLKEQIEREKLALSDLQSKAESEISKAQKLILEKDTELLVAEESLSGLEEVQIHYHGDGEIVEVAGSFNGWHDRIKMDPQPSSNIVDSMNSRKSRLWSTVLWLYPGVYEIKFVVDGHWRIDPHRESVTRGAICNNILRVER